MLIKFLPVRSDATLVISKRGDVLTINGERFDFRPLPEGATLPAQAVGCEWITRPVERLNGELVLTLTLPHGAEATEAARFPFDLVNPPDGNMSLPQ